MRWQVRGQQIDNGAERWRVSAPNLCALMAAQSKGCILEQKVSLWGAFVLFVAAVSSNIAEQQPREDRCDGVCFVIELLLTRCLFPRRGWEEPLIWSCLLRLIKESLIFIHELNTRSSKLCFHDSFSDVLKLYVYLFTGCGTWSRSEHIWDRSKTRR